MKQLVCVGPVGVTMARPKYVSMNTVNSLIVMMLLAGAACGPAPSTPTPAVTITYVTPTPDVVIARPETTQTSTETSTGPFPAASVAWLKAHAVSFLTSSPDGSLDDLQPLKAIIGSAQLVALGEATHGTHEFFEIKHRFLEFLVTQMGFTAFAIEANWPEANLINQYVHTGEGDPARLLAGLGFWTWNTQEVLDMIVWMRQHNATAGAGPQLSFYGFDMQAPGLAMDNVISYLRPTDHSSAAQAEKLYACLRPYQSSATAYNYGKLADADKSTCRKNVQQVHDDLLRHPPATNNSQAASDFGLAVQSARIVQQAEDFLSSQTSSATNTSLRDQYMAENVDWIVKQAGPAAKLVLWAHNGHVGAIEDASTGEKSMGSYLQGTYGPNMVSFGFSIYAGAFNARSNYSNNDHSVKPHSFPVPIPGSYESYFHTARLPRFYLDLRGLSPTTPATAWLLGPHPLYSFGAIYNENFTGQYTRSARLPHEYDVMVYIQDTTPSKLLPFPSN